MDETTAAAARRTTITLTGGRGTVRGELIHANPNYSVLLDTKGCEVRVPAELIDRVTHEQDAPQEAANEREELSTQLYYALLEMFGEEVAVRIENSEAHGAVVYRVGQLLTDGRDLAEMFEALDEDAVRFVPRTEAPAAFLAKQLRQLAGE